MPRAVKTLYLSYETAMVHRLRRWPLSPARSRNSRFDSLISQLRCRPYRRRDKINPRQSYISYCDKWNAAPPGEYVGNCDWLQLGVHVITSPPKYRDKGACWLSYLKNFTKFPTHNNYGCGSVLFWRQRNTLCTSGFVDDVMFGHNRRRNGNDDANTAYTHQRQHQGRSVIWYLRLPSCPMAHVTWPIMKTWRHP